MARVLVYRYGITEKEYEAMWRRRGGKCDICASISLDGKRLHVDHCHENNTIRGLLCGNCNRAIGLMKDSIHLLNSATDYLERSGRLPPRPKTQYQLMGKRA